MITFKEFIEEENNSSAGRFTKVFITRILGKIKELQDSNIDYYIFAFNIYNVEIYFKKEEVVINTIFDDGEFLKLSLNDFYTELFSYYE